MNKVEHNVLTEDNFYNTSTVFTYTPKSTKGEKSNLKHIFPNSTL